MDCLKLKLFALGSILERPGTLEKEYLETQNIRLFFFVKWLLILRPLGLVGSML